MDASGQSLHFGGAWWVFFFFCMACNPRVAAESLSQKLSSSLAQFLRRAELLFFRDGCPLVVEMSAATWEVDPV